MTTPDDIWPLRSLLFTPAHRASWAAKAAATGAHAVILDLEDAVPEDERPAARTGFAAAAAQVAAGGSAAFVRINALEEGGAEDIRAAVGPDLSGLLLPKAATPDQVRRVADLISHAEGAAGVAHGRVAILCLPETAIGMLHAHELARASERVRGLMTGVAGPVEADIARAFGFKPTMEGTEQLYLQSKLVLDSRAAGAMFPVGGVFGTRLDDLAGVELLVRRAKRLGFTGVAIMHPTHVAIANAVFEPSAEEIAYNRGLIETMEQAQAAGKGAVRYQGMMIDHAMLVGSRAIIAEAERAAARRAGRTV